MAAQSGRGRRLLYLCRIWRNSVWISWFPVIFSAPASRFISSSFPSFLPVFTASLCEEAHMYEGRKEFYSLNLQFKLKSWQWFRLSEGGRWSEENSWLLFLSRFTNYWPLLSTFFSWANGKAALRLPECSQCIQLPVQRAGLENKNRGLWRKREMGGAWNQGLKGTDGKWGAAEGDWGTTHMVFVSF